MGTPSVEFMGFSVTRTNRDVLSSVQMEVETSKGLWGDVSYRIPIAISKNIGVQLELETRKFVRTVLFKKTPNDFDNI